MSIYRTRLRTLRLAYLSETVARSRMRFFGSVDEQRHPFASMGIEVAGVLHVRWKMVATRGFEVGNTTG